MGALKIWDLDQLAIVACGIPVSSGYGEGEVMKIEWDEEDFTKKKGADGEVSRSKTYNKCCKITITLMQTASVNALLSALSLIDRKAKNGAGVGPFLAKDLGGATLYAASKCWIAGRPSPTFGREATHRDWVLECSDMESFEGGN